MIKLKRRKIFDRSPEITSLIDIVFILLIFFLLTAVYSPKGISLDLPVAQTATEQKDQDLTISISKDEKIFFNDNLITFEQLENRLKGLQPKNPITVRGDQEIDYGFFVKVMDLIRKSGEHPIILAAENKPSHL